MSIRGCERCRGEKSRFFLEVGAKTAPSGTHMFYALARGEHEEVRAFPAEIWQVAPIFAGFRIFDG